MSLKILHCVIDDKFIDANIELWNNFKECDNKYTIFRKQKKYNKKFTYIKNSEAVEFIDYKSLKYAVIDNNLFDVVILHSLYVLPLKLISEINQKIKVIWFSWGYDIYDYKYGYQLVKTEPLFWTHTQTVIDNLNKKITYKLKNKIINTIKSILRYTLYPYTKTSKEIYENAIHRINYYSGVIPSEYDEIKKNTFFKANCLIYNYASNETPISESNINNIKHSDNKYIIVGNSGDPTSNHIDIFDILKKLHVDTKIVCPLNYGSSIYINEILIKGKDIFGSNFYPIIKFMPIDKYTELLNQCSNAIFAHERQQAMGNIMIAIWNGSKVFMSENSLAYKYLKSIGLKILSIQKDLNKHELECKFDYQTIINNRKILIEYYSYDAGVLKVANIIRIIENDIHFQTI